MEVESNFNHLNEYKFNVLILGKLILRGKPQNPHNFGVKFSSDVCSKWAEHVEYLVLLMEFAIFTPPYY